jgi:polysaccharide pyruvyl transferase WcaK-like protein
MNFLISGGYYRNKGNEAIVKAIINGIVELQGNVHFNVLSEDPDYDAISIYENELVSFLLNPFRKVYFGPVSFLPSCWDYRLIDRLHISPTVRRCMEAFKQSDIVLSTDDTLSSTYGTLLEELVGLKIAASFSKPTILLGQSIGPFKTRADYKAFTKTMKHVQLITARESITLKYLEDMKLENTRIELTADPSFCLEPDREKIEKIYTIYKIPRERPLVGIAPSQGITRYSETSYENHFYILQQLILFLTQNLNCYVVLIPHAQLKNVAYDDRIICDLLYRKIGFPENVSVVSLTHSAEEIRALTSKLDLMIAERMHAAIDSLSQNVPTFVIGYSIKSEGILGDIFGFDSLENYLISIKKIDEAELKKRTKNLFDNRKEVTSTLSKVMPRIKEKAKRNFTLTMDVLERQRK